MSEFSSWIDLAGHLDGFTQSRTRDDDRALRLHLIDAAGALLAGAGTSHARVISHSLGMDLGHTEISSTAAAMAAIIRHTECDDIHLASCITPGSVVFPVALSLARDLDLPRDRIAAAIECGLRTAIGLGMLMGGVEALARGVWPTYAAAPVVAAVVAGRCLGLNDRALGTAMAIAAAGTNGKLASPSSDPQARWIAFGKAVASGCWAATDVDRGAHREVVDFAPWIETVAPGVHASAAMFAATSFADVGIKPFVTGRQCANAVIGFQTMLAKGLDPLAVEEIEIGVPTRNHALVARSAAPGDRISTIGSGSFQIAAAALNPGLLFDVAREGQPVAALQAYSQRVRAVVAADLDVHMPRLWPARVRAFAEGRWLEETVLRIPGDCTATQLEDVVRRKLVGILPAALAEPLLAMLDSTSWSKAFDVVQGLSVRSGLATTTIS